MNGASVVASLPLTSPLITPSTGEAEPRGSSCVLYDAYNTFCTIPIRNVLNATNEGIWTLRMNGTSVVASLPLTSPLITPSTGEAEPRGSSCVLYDAYNTFCTIHICNIWTLRKGPPGTSSSRGGELRNAETMISAIPSSHATGRDPLR